MCIYIYIYICIYVCIYKRSTRRTACSQAALTCRHSAQLAPGASKGRLEPNTNIHKKKKKKNDNNNNNNNNVLCYYE